jgi:glycosyltransferase involved in cell wall biosynthesis
MNSGRVRSIWAGTPIINMAYNARAERLLGVNSKSLVYHTYFITDDFDYNLERWVSLPILGWLIPLGIFLWASLFVDRLHFYCDRGLLPPRGHFTFDFVELYVYKLMRIPVFFWTYGADVRTRDVAVAMGHPNCCSDCDEIGRYCICDGKRWRRNFERLSRLSKAIFSGMGDMFDYTPGSMNKTYYWPVDLGANKGSKYKPVYSDVDIESPIRIVHAPNHRIFKGSKYLIKAIEELQSEGLSIELVLVEKIANDKALEIYRSADVIFDQCLMGNFGYFAIEAMALGKPVMCFIRDPKKYVLHSEECPIVNTHISSLKNDIRELVENRGQLKDIGKRGRKYVEKHFSLEAFAGRLKQVYDELETNV